MESDQVFKHLCKLCNRSFPCGRSLGGHMRSHFMNSQAETGEKLKKVRIDKCLGAGIHDGYSLRRNPKKTCRLADFSAAAAATAMELDRFCKECGKGFQSWKALFCHMKCHSIETERVSSNLEFDSQSDNEIPASNHGKRSSRRQITRYMATETSSSFSFAAAAASSSVSDHNDHEQEEVALCLMMLSRDVNGFCSATESSDNNSMSKNNFSKVEGRIPSLCMGSKIMKLNEFHSKKLEIREMGSGLDSEFSDSVVKIINKNQKPHHDHETELYQPQFISSNKKERNFELMMSNSMRKPTPDNLNSVKRSKFQCNSCDKIFHSYQALGGHRASHKKGKGSLVSKIESSENSIETEISNDPTFESNPTTCCEIENQNEIEMGNDKKIKKSHKCSICFKIFSSGQALGGHKRSHLISGSESESRNKFTVIQKPEAEIRDFLDLNLPAPVEEEAQNHLASLGSWWVGSSHQHEHPLVGLI